MMRCGEFSVTLIWLKHGWAEGEARRFGRDIALRCPDGAARRPYQLIQSHKNNSSKKPYRAGQSLAAPPSRDAQVFSSFLKNCARCDRTLSVSGSFSIVRQLLSLATRLTGLSGSAPKKPRIERRSSVGFLCRSSKK